MLNTLCWCVTSIICVMLISHINITVIHKNDTVTAEKPGLTDSDVTAAYAELDKDPVPDFADIIDKINREFGGVTSDE